MQSLPTLQSIQRKSLLALDYGTKFCGLAIYKVGIDPYPLMYGRIPYKDDKSLVNELKKIIEDEFVNIMLVGVPYFTDGTESKVTKRIKGFMAYLQKQVEINCFEVDETLTSFEAEQRMQNDPQFNFKVDPQRIDALSATIFIEEFMKGLK